MKSVRRELPKNNYYNYQTGDLTIIEPCTTLDFVNGEVKEIIASDDTQCFANNILLQKVNLESVPKRLLGGKNVSFEDCFRKSSFNSDLELYLEGGSYETVFQECDFKGYSVKLILSGECSLNGMFDQTKNLKSLEIIGGRVINANKLVSCSKELEKLIIKSEFYGDVNFNRMCFCCKSLKEVNLSESTMELYNPIVTGMFYCCKSLQKCNLGAFKVYFSEHPDVSFMYSFCSGDLMGNPFDFSKAFKMKRILNEPIKINPIKDSWYQKGDGGVLHINPSGILIEKLTENEIWLPYGFSEMNEGEIINRIDYKLFRGDIIEGYMYEFPEDEEKEKNVFRDVEGNETIISSETGIPMSWMKNNKDYPM